MKTIKLSIENIKCLRTSIEFGADEVYLGVLFIPIKGKGGAITNGKVKSFATNEVSMKKDWELGKIQIKNWNHEFELADDCDDYILVLQLMEKDDGEIQKKFNSEGLAEAILNVDILGNIIERLISGIKLGEIEMNAILQTLCKMLLKSLPASIYGLIVDITKQIRMDDVIASKSFTQEKITTLNLPKTFQFSNLFAKYQLDVSVTEE